MAHLHRLVLGTVLAVLAVVACGAARAADPDKLLPASSDTVVQINLRQLLDSDISKKYALEQIKQALDGQSLKDAMAEFGLNPLKDLDQLIIAGSGTSREDTKLFFILHGKFNPEKLYQAAEAQTRKEPDKISKVLDGDTVMFKFIPENAVVPQLFITVIDENTVIAASEQKEIKLAVRASKDDDGANLKKKELAALIRKLDGKATIIAATVVKGKLDDARLPGGGNLPLDLSSFQDLLPKVETMSLSIEVKSDIFIEMTVGMKDDNSAADFRAALDQLLKQLKPLAQLGGAADPRFKPLTDVLNTFRTSNRKSDVTIIGKVTGANIGKMINPDE
jgi:hypothetical protein